ncbi:Dolichyl-phosphate-mannose-protein mannosyltransferase-domain-containing protein [Scheffersomyces coipomensis]|uniref:Dolichyl-phosphate-mannose-protein mannosyltransferase-domain-containing protein n=1 Tax=Scheffersomyces coipomensis TaxID=1788519 RepID=UPI00315DE8B8
MSTLKKRGGKKGAVATTTSSIELPEDDKVVSVEKTDSEFKYWLGLMLVTGLAIYTRFNKISIPDKVVFDEVHFGKFASYYLERTYFFDLHPPFAKMLIAFAGWLIGYSGKFKFDNIGDSYIDNSVPYIAYRALSAIQGSAIVPLIYLTMKNLKFSIPACLLSSIIVCFDNAQVADSRLILLDATLNLSVALTMFTYTKFSTFRKQPFSQDWWIWLIATGVSLSCVISTKYVGVFTFVTIGLAVLHELWILLDYKKGLTLVEFSKHFFSRFFALIIVPFTIYLFWFYLHFAILNKSGPGDSFMSSEFQETLSESPLAKFSKPVKFYDTITIKHKETDAFLHSHEFVYPLRYEDGRISSNKQQVTCVFDPDSKEHLDANNHWVVEPASADVQKGVDIFTNDVIRLRHAGTNGYLLAHDVASPLKPTNEEFIVVHGEDAQAHYNETLFRLRDAEGGSNKNKNRRKLVKTKASPLRIVHVDTVVAMWTHDDEVLPDWGFGQQEVSGNKKIQQTDNIWTFDNIIGLQAGDKRSQYVPKEVKKIPFLKKWWELQGLMFHHNNILTSEHPFASQPDSWPLALSGVSFYNDNDLRRQIFFTGNIVGFWSEVAFLAIYLGLLLADQISRRRDVYILSDKARSRLYNTLGFFFVGWSSHYFPFYLMNRQKFLHHYLPAHLIAALFTGGIVEFLCTNNSRINDGTPKGVNKIKISLLVALLSGGIVWFFFYFRPLTYGDVSLTVEEVKARQWFDIKLHYAK